MIRKWLSELESKKIIYAFLFLILILDIFILYFAFVSKVWEITLFSIVSFVITLFVFLLFKITNRKLKKIIDSSQKISQGELNINDIILVEKAESDFTILASAFNTMKSNLLFFIDNTKKNVITLSSAIDMVNENLNMSLAGNEEVARTVENVASGAVQQLDISQETVVRIDSIYGSVENISVNIESVQEIAAETNRMSQNGKENINKYEEKIKIISSNIVDTGKFINELRESIEEITRVFDFIVGINGQLKLLSLNAAIEAARSGEMGKGFAVVANEITKLSDATRKEIEKIDIIVSSLIENSSKVDSSIISSINEFENGAIIFNEAKYTFELINTQNGEILNRVTNILKDIVNIKDVTKKTHELSQESFDSSSMAARSMKEISIVISEELKEFHEINDTVSNLQKFVSKIDNQTSIFKVGVVPVKGTKQLKIGFLVPLIKRSELWSFILDGALYAKKELVEKNAKIDIKPLPYSNHDNLANQMVEEIERMIREKYDGVCLPPPNTTVKNIVEKASSKGLKVMYFNCDMAVPSSRIGVVRQNSYEAGKLAADIIERRAGKKARILCIVNKGKSTADYELKYNGFLDRMKEKKILKIVDTQQISDTEEETYKKFKGYFIKNKGSFDAIYYVARFKLKIAQALEESGLGGTVEFTVYDIDNLTCDFIRRKVMTSAIGQDPFGQGHDSIISLYNYLSLGNKLKDENIWTRLEVVDTENIHRILN